MNESVITITWKPEEQTVGLNFDPKEFKTWDFLIAVMDIAKRHCEAQARTAQAHTLMQKQAEAQQAIHLRNKLHLG